MEPAHNPSVIGREQKNSEGGAFQFVTPLREMTQLSKVKHNMQKITEKSRNLKKDIK